MDAAVSPPTPAPTIMTSHRSDMMENIAQVKVLNKNSEGLFWKIFDFLFERLEEGSRI
jgi:hypothetical protein